MEKYETSDYWNGIYKAEELEKKLKKYKGVLSPKTIEYLESILHLEMSVIKKEISDEDRVVLSYLPIYGQISKFNLYNGAINLIKNNKRGIDFTDSSSDGLNFIFVKSKNDKKARIIYHYDFARDFIRINEYLPSEEKRNEEIERQKYELRRIHVPGRPDVDWEGKQLVGGPHNLETSKAINKYKNTEKYIEELESINGLTEIDKNVIKLSKKFSDLFLEEYGLTHEDFTEKDVNSKILEKSYVKVPHTVKVYREIHYI